jgi:hypothetical protein
MRNPFFIKNEEELVVIVISDKLPVVIYWMIQFHKIDRCNLKSPSHGQPFQKLNFFSGFLKLYGPEYLIVLRKFINFVKFFF